MVGVQMVREAAKRGRLQVALVAGDAAKNSLDKIYAASRSQEHPGDRGILGLGARRCRRDVKAVAVIGVTDAGLAKGIKEVVL